MFHSLSSLKKDSLLAAAAVNFFLCATLFTRLEYFDLFSYYAFPSALLTTSVDSA